MAFSNGMTNRQWLIHGKARCLHYLLASVMKEAEKMRNEVIETITRLAEKEAEGDLQIQQERERYYLNVFNTAIPDDMEKTFLESMVVQICSYLESVLEDIAQDKRQDKGVCKVESYYNHIQREKGINLGPLSNHIKDWNNLHRMRNEIAHDGHTAQKLTHGYIEKSIEEAKNFLIKVDEA